MASGLDGIKSALSEGARSNKYKVFISDLGDAATTLAKATSLPGWTIGMAEVYSQGRKVPLAGDAAYDTWDVTFYNSKDLGLRQEIEKWMIGIDDYDTNSAGTPDLGSYTREIQVSQLDRNGDVQQTFSLQNAWPTTVAAIDLGSDSNDQVSEFTVTFAYTHIKQSS